MGEKYEVEASIIVGLAQTYLECVLGSVFNFEVTLASQTLLAHFEFEVLHDKLVDSQLNLEGLLSKVVGCIGSLVAFLDGPEHVELNFLTRVNLVAVL